MIPVEPERYAGFDIVGDVHGCAAELRALLEKLGYVNSRGQWHYRDRARPRLLLMVGDIVDRGPAIREAVLLTRELVDSGAALMVMGNHEYDAIGWCTEARPGSDRRWLREHNQRHESLIAETLAQFAAHDDDWRDAVAWFRTLPLFLDLGSLRVVHACWDNDLIRRFLKMYREPYLNEEFLHRSADPDSFAAEFMHRTLRGMDMILPNGLVMTSAEGFKRRFFRVKYWSEEADTWGDIQFQPDPLPPEVARLPLSQALREQLCLYGPDEPPLFMGHYWQRGRPRPQSDNVACLDYSAVNGGRLVAYRFDAGERRLRQDAFVSVDATGPERQSRIQA